MGADNYVTRMVYWDQDVQDERLMRRYQAALALIGALRPYMELREQLGGHRSKLGNELALAWKKYNEQVAER